MRSLDVDEVKYGNWNISEPEMGAVNALVGSGYPPLAAMVLSARGIENPRQAHALLDCNAPLPDPYLMTDMATAARRVAVALEKKQRIAVFGDYDVDGITATCLLTDFLRRHGADCVSYIPGRLEEGYGLNAMAIRQLHKQGVQLIVTVDCGITAVEEALLCRELGMELVITDHHECKLTLPDAVAVVDPHRPDGGYSHMDLSGVGVAFKLAAALAGSQEEVLAEYADMVCLGTVADVMPLRGENRVFVARGLEQMKKKPRPGMAALMEACGCTPETINASTIGYMLAPRINAAGRMCRIELAVELFLTNDPLRAAELAQGLCDLNRQRQAVESEIYQQAVSMLPPGRPPEAIVLASENWHQGVVGIVASRLAEEYCCPAFLICLDGDHGKASSRSYGGFNLFASLSSLSHLLESYGGHELAAGFTIARDRIDAFRREISSLASAFYDSTGTRTTLEVDCSIPAELLTQSNVEALDLLEPCGNGCPKPVLAIEQLRIERINLVGNGRHMRLRFRQGYHVLNAIYFSATPESASIQPGDLVDVAFVPQVNEYKEVHTVQMNVLDIRPHCQAPCPTDTADYRRLRSGRLEPGRAQVLLPDRATMALVWRYLQGCGSSVIQEEPVCLCRKIVRWSGKSLSLGQLLICLDIWREVRLVETQRLHHGLLIRLTPGTQKADLQQSQTMQILLRLKES